VSLLLSEPQEAESPQAFLMPSLTGLTLAGAAARAYAAGLRIVSAEDLNTPTPATVATDASAPATVVSPSTSPAPTPASPPTQSISIGTVIAQTPPAGHRVVKGDPVRITLTN
jgi:beta-lactam-binding protein with PASTA domain